MMSVVTSQLSAFIFRQCPVLRVPLRYDVSVCAGIRGLSSSLIIPGKTWNLELRVKFQEHNILCPINAEAYNEAR